MSHNKNEMQRHAEGEGSDYPNQRGKSTKRRTDIGYVHLCSTSCSNHVRKKSLKG